MTLLVFRQDRLVGHVRTDGSGRPRFNYDRGWRSDPEAIPLSLSLPLSAEDHPPETVAAVLWGLLPDNERTLQRWASRFHVSPRDPTTLLAHVGRDCAGAFSFVPQGDRETWLARSEDGTDWLDVAEIGRRLARLRADHGATREPDDVGQFSLAGAQPKIALLQLEGRWGVPRGRIPTTHILKPPTGEFDGFVENEHFCLRLAQALGLPVAESRVLRFGDEPSICVTRYDRMLHDGNFFRIHQEDLCQAQGVHPQLKYQNQGGPSPAGIARVLRAHSRRAQHDLETFFRALAYNWLIAGSDAHAKNYSLLLGPRGHVRLAPLYDLISALPYPQFTRREITLAMKIGGHYRWWDIGARDWRALAQDMGLDAERGLALVQEMAERIADAAQTCGRQVRGDGLVHPVLDRLIDSIANEAQRYRRLLAATAANRPHE